MAQQGNIFCENLSVDIYNTEDDMYRDIDHFIYNISNELNLYERYIYEELHILRFIDICLSNYRDYSPKNFYAYLYNEIQSRESIEL